MAEIKDFVDVNGDGVIDRLDGYSPEQLEVLKQLIELEKLKVEKEERNQREADKQAKITEFKATGRVWKQGDAEDLSHNRFTAGWYNDNMEVLVEASGTFTWVKRRPL